MTLREMHEKMDYSPLHHELATRLEAIRNDKMCQMIHNGKEILVVAVTEDIEDGLTFARNISLFAVPSDVTGKEIMAGAKADKEHLLLVYPENTLTPKYTRQLIDNLCKRKFLKSAVIITKEAVILTDCHKTNVVILTVNEKD